ncbi:Crp/Fnr family transcriptional regulator [Rhizobium rosettiformans]|uniref:Crp/Fnr family transcriptional regulator n=1 Tax=Rhizobium rosettiformans TaxID=1368430 RepID=UPI00285523F7|nr:helix-turn-helix domain-containing protein [Rhizobium rosettiformans]MDR7028129.1 CRP/FNR family transcriptional regulator [Rhizobium rosettiformans]MDR7064589.1 CRP/FNR family transcriptional regulator [Rhizobium rosettiformans]
MLQMLANSAAPPAFPRISSTTPDLRTASLSGPLLPPRTVVFLEGLARSPQYRVVDGCIATAQTLTDGRRQIIDLVGPGRLIGLGFGDQNRYSAETLGFTRLELVPDSLTQGERDQALSEMLARSQSLVMLLGRKTAPERVASALIDLALQFGRPARDRKRGAVTFHLYPTRGDLADWLGLTIETVSRCLTRLKKAGLIDIRHGDLVTVLDQRELAGVAAGDRALSN